METPTPRWTTPAKLQSSDPVSDFRSGSRELDTWLEKFAFMNQQAGMASVFVTKSGSTLAGYYALSAGGVEPASASARVKKGVGSHPIPVILLARLAVGEEFHGQGLGRSLMRDALVRVEAAADDIGVRALLLHAKDESARAFYMKVAEFEQSPTDPMHLMLLMKDLRAALKS